MTGPKHLSGMTVVAHEQPGSPYSHHSHPSPGLPGYMPMTPPPEHTSYAPTDGTLSPQTPNMPRSPSPGQIGVPAYTAHAQPSVDERLQQGPHEMPTEETGGLRGFFRRGSTKKEGTAERYG